MIFKTYVLWIIDFLTDACV